MTDKLCPICRGEQRVRIPLRYDIDVSQGPDFHEPFIRESYRDYDCPECTNQVRYTKVGVMRTRSSVDELREESALSAFGQEQRKLHQIKLAASMIADKLAREGWIEIENIPGDEFHDAVLQCTLRVVRAEEVATFEERIVEKAIELGNEVAERSIFEIQNWGSFFGHSEILKSDAYRMVESALRYVKDKYVKKKKK